MSHITALVPLKPNDATKVYHNFTNKFVEDSELAKPSKEVGSAISIHTKKTIENLVGVKTMSSQGGAAGNIGKLPDHQFIKYTPNSQNIHATPTQRIIKMKEVQKDPLQPAAFKHKRIPKGLGSPPTTIMHSPPRKITVKDQQDWKIPPCISNWKNAKGYTIPLDMRISADGRTLQNHTVNEKFAQLADAFYVAERQARKDIEERNKMKNSIAYKEHLKKEENLRAAAVKAREEKNQILARSLAGGNDSRKQTEDPEESEEKRERDEFRYIRKREIEREKRLEASGYNKSKAARDADRDISEKIALGQAQPTNNEVMFVQRLFNQNAGLDSGFISDDENNLYDKPLFNDRTAASIYKNVRNTNVDDDDDEGEKGGKKSDMEKILSRNPARGFEGAEKRAEPRNKPVEFEKHNDDIFGMDSFVHDARKKQKF